MSLPYYMEDILKRTFGFSHCDPKCFDENLSRLPSVSELRGGVSGDFGCLRNYSFRGRYVPRSFVVLSDEWINDLACFTNEFDSVIEVGCGEGWLSWWILRYGGRVDRMVDNFSWDYQKHRHNFVERVNDLSAVSDYNLIILSWPDYDSSFAYDVWNRMSAGSVLLYIGESEGGCTGDYMFHNTVDEYLSDDRGLNSNFSSFTGIYDRCWIYEKTNNCFNKRGTGHVFDIFI